jgi:hypothetical protein
MPLSASVLFHINLNYSSIEVEERESVVRRCYWPLLELIERLPGLVLTLEASGHSLEQIERIDQRWIERLCTLVRTGAASFIGSGDSQVVGPLVPWSVNRWNQRLGRATYARLGLSPRVALVNELAWSQGLVDSYLDAGYELVVMEWNNPRRSHPEWVEEERYRSAWTRSPSGQRIRILWSDAILFQTFQRAVAGEVDEDEYADGILARASEHPRHLFLYSSDAEVFDYRPGRYRSEPSLARGASEWERIAGLLSALATRGVHFTSPERVLDDPAFAPRCELSLSSAAEPIPVKKQPKYNVSRWGLTGRDDVGINARCFDRTRELEEFGSSARESDWRELCRAFGSDLRTHLTEKRWRALAGELPEARPPQPPPATVALTRSSVRPDGRRLWIETDGVRVALLLQRGLAIDSLAFPRVATKPLIGTLPFGTFESIEWAADFYSGHTVLDVPAQMRITDLERVVPRIDERDDAIDVVAEVPTPLGALVKRVRIMSDSIAIFFGFAALGERPAGTLRTGHVTLLDGGFGAQLALVCANGGPPERFGLPLQGEPNAEFDHGASVSPLVSARTALGATEGTLTLDDGAIALDVNWCQSRVAALPLASQRFVDGKRFVRISFSLAEIDETFRPGARLHDFELEIRGRRCAAGQRVDSGRRAA